MAERATAGRRRAMVQSLPRGARPRPAQQRNAAARRAVQAARAEPRRPLVAPEFVAWALARVVAMLVVVGGGWLVYTLSTSSTWRVREVHVQGASLLSRAEVEQAAQVIGANVFWVDRAAVEARLRRLPVVLRAEATPVLPDKIEVRIVERQPAAFWVSGAEAYVVDDQGVVLRRLGPDEGVVADHPLPTIDESDGRLLNMGDVVDPSALATWTRLLRLLPRAGVRPVEVDWGQDVGLEVHTDEGWRVRFDSAGNVEHQVDSLRAIRDYLAKTRTSAEVIDVRFGDRPYYR